MFDRSTKIVVANWKMFGDFEFTIHYFKHLCNEMLDENLNPFTAHTTNLVPFAVVNHPCELRDGGRLADIAPTMLKLLGLPQPEEIDGESIIK